MKKKIQALCASLFMGILLFMAGVQTFAGPSYTSKFSDWGNLLKQYANDENGNERSQDYNPGNSDVVVSLKDGEIITTSFMNSNYYDTKISDDNAKLIFTTVK